MSKQLWLLRHAVAEPHGTRADSARKLTTRGQSQARDAGLALRKLGVEFELVLTSPRVRARDTARLACAALGCEPANHNPLSAGFDASEALALLEGVSDGGRTLLVGHEPDFSRVVYDLAGGRIDLKKGGIAVVRANARARELILLLRPRELRLIARA